MSDSITELVSADTCHAMKLDWHDGLGDSARGARQAGPPGCLPACQSAARRRFAMTASARRRSSPSSATTALVASAEQLAAEGGMAPITRESGKRRAVSFRWAGDVRLRSLWSRIHSPGARSTRRARDRRHEHAHAIRILSRAWYRIICTCWQSHMAYDATKHRAVQSFAVNFVEQEVAWRERSWHRMSHRPPQFPQSRPRAAGPSGEYRASPVLEVTVRWNQSHRTIFGLILTALCRARPDRCAPVGAQHNHRHSDGQDVHRRSRSGSRVEAMRAWPLARPRSCRSRAAHGGGPGRSFWSGSRGT